MRYFLIAVFAVLFLGCQKETRVETDKPVNPLPQANAVFTLSGSPNTCTGALVNGAYIVNTVLTASNTITIQVNVITAGPYTISTNTVNGYKFSAAGTFTTTGNQNVTLTGSGTPIVAGTDSFTPQAGTAGCTFSVSVVAPTPAVFTLAGTPNACAAASVNGTYLLNTPLSASNTVAIQVNVTSTGPYTITTNTVAGISFSAKGAFTTTGNQTVTLTGSGTPTAQGAATFTPQVSNSSCTFTVNVLGAASFTMAGAPGACTNPTINGTYTVGSPLAASNTVTVLVNVTTPGTYTLSTNTVGGMTFSKSGTFTTTGTQSVTLIGSGIPTTAGANMLTPQAGTSSCIFSVNVTGPAVYTFGGAPGVCTNGLVSGTYTVGAALTSANTVAVQVNVTAVGGYNITTTTVDGIKFSNSGTFTTTGLQTVTLTGSGTPTTAGVNTLTVGTNGCTFDVNVSAPAGTYNCKINGVYTNFIDRAHAEVLDNFYNPAQPYLYLDGYTGPPNGGFIPEFQIFINKNNNSVVGTGTYNVDGYLLPSGGYRLEIDYHAENPDQSVTIWNTSSTIITPNPAFTVIITSRTATRITGTFSGTLKDPVKGGTVTKTITEGVFDLPIY